MVYTIYMGKVESLVFLYSSFPDIYKWWNIQIHVFDREELSLYSYFIHVRRLLICLCADTSKYKITTVPTFWTLVFKNPWLSQSH